MSWTIRRYTPGDKMSWDAFIDGARNATFLFRRDYIDYHADRFTDCSLMAFRNGKLAAVLPANIQGDTLYSHQGLTYGGWCLLSHPVDGADYWDLWMSWLDWCHGQKIQTIIYKPLPSIYHLIPSQEDIYMLSKTGQIMESNLSSAIDLTMNPGFNKLQKRHLLHAPSDLSIKFFNGLLKTEVENFHRMLTECLESRHGATPVHTLDELQLLMDRFPENIMIWTAGRDNTMEAGVCAFYTPRCMHCQYIATTPSGREDNILPALFNRMIEWATEYQWRYFDFGISNERDGDLNYGLNRQKTSFGGTGVVYSKWSIPVFSAARGLLSEL